jgi:hypothetical protein
LQLALSIRENSILKLVETEPPYARSRHSVRLRTPIGTAMKGTLRDTDAYQLAEHVVGTAVADLDSGAIDRDSW